MATPEPSNIDEELSAASTTILLDRLAQRLVVRPYVLAFRDAKTWANAYRACESKILHQCETGSRIGCTLSASSKCKSPWWRFLIGQKAPELKQRAECEERETEGRLATVKEKCIGFARDKCLQPFKEGNTVNKC